MRNKPFNWIGIGLYTIPEATHLTGVAAADIRRWTNGSGPNSRGEGQSGPAVWQDGVPSTVHGVGISFHDLIEIRILQAFRNYGLPWSEIRQAATRTATLLKTTHPFAAQRFSTEGRRIFHEVGDEAKSEKLIEISSNQQAFRRIVSPAQKGLVFAESMASLWYPMFPKRQVVVDPRRCFGRPIIASAGVPTEILARAAEAEDSVAEAARWYDVPKAAVIAAMDFEDRLAA